MNRSSWTDPRLAIMAVLAVAVLIGLVLATGGGLSSGGSNPTSPPVAAATATVTPAGTVQGTVSLQVRRLQGHIWHFAYTVRNTGKVPIAGFQLNAAQSNLFHVIGPANWNVYGSGICNGPQKGVLAYWSTTATSATLIKPHGSATFAFDVNTTGKGPGSYSLSWGVAQPFFSNIPAPAASTLPAKRSCP